MMRNATDKDPSIYILLIILLKINVEKFLIFLAVLVVAFA